MAEIKQPPRQRLGLDWLQMRDTICGATGMGFYLLLISLSSRRRERPIAQMLAVKPGIRATPSHWALLRDNWADAPMKVG